MAPPPFPYLGWASTSSSFPSPRHRVGGIRAIDERRVARSETSRFLPDVQESHTLVQTPLRAHGEAVADRSPPTRTRLTFEEERLPVDVRQVVYGRPDQQRDRTCDGQGAHGLAAAISSRESIGASDREVTCVYSDEVVGQKRVALEVASAPQIRRPYRGGTSVYEQVVSGLGTPQRNRTPKSARKLKQGRGTRSSTPVQTTLSGGSADAIQVSSSSPNSAEFMDLLFPMYKKRKPAHWVFILLICKDEYRHIPQADRRSEHARCAYCTKCNTEIKFQQSVTSYVTRHMKTCHKKELRQAEKDLREQNRGQKLVHREIDDAPSEVREVCNQGDQSRCDDLATIWVCKSARPFIIVEDKYFRKYSRHLNRVRGRIRIPKAWKVRERVGVIADDLRDALKKELGLECDFYSASSDIWTSRNKAAFICFTIHYVDREFQMHSWVLEVKSLPGKHDANAIARVLQEFMTGWGLKREKCVKFLRDGASNGRKACDMLGLDSMSCLAHCLHLIVGSGIVKKRADVSAEVLMKAAKSSEEFDAAIEAQASEEVDTFIASECANTRADLDMLRAVVEQFRKLAVFFSRSPKAMEQLTLLQKQKSLQTITDCATRWNSTHAMLVRMLELRPVIDNFFQYVASSGEFSDSTADQPTAEQWFTIRCLVVLLEPFARASNGLGGEKYPTLVMAVPVLWSVKRKLANEHIFDSILRSGGKEDYVPRVEALIQSVRKTYVRLFSDRFINPTKTTSRFSKKSAKKSISRTVNKDKIPDELMWISILDPRSSELKYLSPAEAEQAREQLLDAAVEMAKQINAVNECTNENTDTTSSAQLTTPHKENVAWLTDVFGGGIEDYVEEPLPVDDEKIRERCKSQLLLYMSNAHNTPVTTSALQWWRDNQKGCSIIAALARKWLGCIATSVPSERAFSKSGNVVTTKRCSLASDTIRDVMFVSENYEEEDSCGESDDDTGDEN